MEKFCGSQFWDSNLTWYSSDPDLTPCFEKTILSWTPCIFLWISVGLDFAFSKPRWGRSPWTNLSTIKGILAVLLIIAEIGRYIYLTHFTEDFVPPQVDVLDRALKVITLLIYAAWLIRYQSPGVQFTFWFLLMTCEGIILTSIVRETLENGKPINPNLALKCISGGLILLQFLLSCFSDSDGYATDKGYDEITKFPEDPASPMSQLFFAWLDPLIWKGFRTPLLVRDLWDLSEDDKSSTIVSKFDKVWNWEFTKPQKYGIKLIEYGSISNGKSSHTNSSTPFMEKPKTTKRYQNMIPCLIKLFGPCVLVASVLRIIQDLMALSSPLILYLLISFVKDGHEEGWKGYLFATGLFVLAVSQSLLNAHNNKILNRTGLRIRAALVSAMYRKSLLISNSGQKGSTSGEIMNMMDVDVRKVFLFMKCCNMLWCAPLQIVLGIWMLWIILGNSVWSGFAVMIVCTIFNLRFTAWLKRNQNLIMKYKDKRVQLMSQILTGMKVVKLYGWETSFSEQITKIRQKELKVVKSNLDINVVSTFFTICTPFYMSLATFATYVMIDDENVLDAQKAFVSLALFNLLRNALMIFPDTLGCALQAYVSLKRISNFMNTDEIDSSAIMHNENSEDAIVIQNGKFSWDELDLPTLKNININIKKGSLVAIVGIVGSGKSSLLSAILGELEKISGLVNTTGAITYVPQQAWIQNNTLKENILFGTPFAEFPYRKVIHDCALLPDLATLTAGDATEIGEKGINLSGGQKQRVSLARAVYNNADIYLLDDPLSAVDCHVGKHIFDHVIGPNGSLKGKTRVLVTHGISFLPQVDNIIVLKDGRVSEVGTYKSLLRKKGDFGEFLAQHTPESERISLNKEAIEKGIEIPMSVKRARLASINLNPEQEEEEMAGEKYMTVETFEMNNVKSSVYLEYCRAAGWTVIALSILFFTLFQGLVIAANFWLSAWTRSESARNNTMLIQNSKQDDQYLEIYGGLGVGQAIALLTACYVLGLGALKSSVSLHLRMLTRVLRAPMSYFDTTPLGRLINRFSYDVDIVDNNLPLFIRRWMVFAFQVIGIFVIICYNLPIFNVVVLPITALFYITQRIYVQTSRQLKRLESVSRSPIYSHFGETISGLSTIRAYRMERRFTMESEQKTDKNLMCCFPAVMAERWLEVRLDLIGNLIVLFTAIFTVMTRHNLDPGLAGLVLSTALQIVRGLGGFVTWTSEVEANIVSVERLKEYGEGPQEAEWKIPGRKPPTTWPENGVVEFDNYHSRYQDGMPYILKGIRCCITAGEKIGIVGRTGAGKSSLALALFRLIEPTMGTIRIDGVDITTIGLHDLRQRITIIPQDPTLFSGSLRMNLDPFGVYTDDKLWRTLKLAHLKAFISGLPGGLDHKITEGGENFSVGQRQLICLARAILRKTKLLVLDEATAAVDLETDDLIQKTIKSRFSDSTVLTIAHRLNTIMDANRVMILDKGEICEFDSPSNLLQRKSSIFYSLAEEAGLILI